MVILQDGHVRLRLERMLTKKDAYGVWDYHVSENSQMFKGLQAGRHAAVLPAEPREGQEVEFYAMLTPSAQREEWLPLGKGIATYLR